MHEVGHTLGLNHNMGSHNLYAPEALHNAAVTRSTGLVVSYGLSGYQTLPWIRPIRDSSTPTAPGPYDMWGPLSTATHSALEDPEAEEARLTRILERSTEPELFFGNDADDMRSPGKAIDPAISTSGPCRPIPSPTDRNA